MIKKIIGGMVIAGSLIGLGACHRHCGRNGGWFRDTPEEKAAWFVKKASKKLELSEAQQAALREVTGELLAFREAFHKDQAGHHKAALAMFMEPELDQQAILDHVNEKQLLVEERSPKIVEKVAAFHKTLTPEQKDKLAAKFRKHVEDCE